MFPVFLYVSVYTRVSLSVSRRGCIIVAAMVRRIAVFFQTYFSFSFLSFFCLFAFFLYKARVRYKSRKRTTLLSDRIPFFSSVLRDGRIAKQPNRVTDSERIRSSGNKIPKFRRELLDLFLRRAGNGGVYSEISFPEKFVHVMVRMAFRLKKNPRDNLETC